MDASMDPRMCYTSGNGNYILNFEQKAMPAECIFRHMSESKLRLNERNHSPWASTMPYMKDSCDKRMWLVVLLWLGGFAFSRAQAPQTRVDPISSKLPTHDARDIHFTHLTTVEGLSQMRVSHIVQDDQGFLWFGTLYGLNRFDGYSFKVFLHEPGNPNSLSGVSAISLFKDHQGALWIGGEEALDRFDPRTGIFTHYPVAMVRSVSQDHNDALWLSTGHGLYRLNPGDGSIREFLHKPEDPGGLPNNDIFSAAEDKTGRFWVAGPSGLDELDRATGHIKLHIPIRNPSRDSSFFEDRFGTFWITYATGSGLASFDRKTNVLTYYSLGEDEGSDTAISGAIAMLEDRNGTLWIATQGSGLLKFDRDHRQFFKYTSTYGDSGSLGENRVTTLFQDREGNIWVALFDKGLQHFEPTPAAFHAVGLEPKQGGIGCFYEDSHQNLWIGTRPALYRIDAYGKKTAFTGVKPGLPFDVISVIEDLHGFIWVGTFSNGLFRLDPKTGSWKNYRHKEEDSSSISSDIVNRLMVDHNGALWAATWDGLNRFDASTERFTTFRADAHLRELMYLSMIEGADHHIWLGTYGFGLQRFNPETGQFTTFASKDGLSDNGVKSIHPDSKGKLWLGTQNGLDEFDPITKQVTIYSTPEGLTGTDLDCVLGDTEGKLWMSTNKGIASFDPIAKTFRNFTQNDGLPGEQMGDWGACLRSRAGQMYFAGVGGATTFLPKAVPERKYMPPIVITDLQILGQDHSPKAESAPTTAISYASSITLTHDQGLFSLGFAALQYSSPPTRRYRYKLEGLDSSWNEVGGDSRSVTYTGLPARKYRFVVQSTTSSNQWSDSGAALQITILPPWWSTWWFRTAYVLLTAFLAWSFYRHRIHQIARQAEIELHAQVNERTRIARELHDTLLQGVLMAAMKLDVAEDRIPDQSPAKPLVGRVLQILREVTEEGRITLRGLRTSDGTMEDLASALLRVGKELPKQEDLNFRIVTPNASRPLHPQVRDEVYRIGREAVLNAFQHANAKNIEVEIEYTPFHLRLGVSDDGDGLDPRVLQSGRDGHWGLRGMQERAEHLGATLTLKSRLGDGTNLDLTVPAEVAFSDSRPSWLSRWLFFTSRPPVKRPKSKRQS